jgi:hypothetical protein
MVSETWSRLVAYAAVGTFLAGPGAVVGGAWLWREEILASKRAAGAGEKLNHGLDIEGGNGGAYGFRQWRFGSGSGDSFLGRIKRMADSATRRRGQYDA